MFRDTIKLKEITGRVEKLDEDLIKNIQEGVFASLEDIEAITFKKQIKAIRQDMSELMGNISVNPKLNKALYSEYFKILKSFEIFLKKNNIDKEIK